MSIDDVYRITPVWTFSDGRRNTTHIDVRPYGSLTPAPSISDVGAAVVDWWDDLKDHWPGNMSLDHVELRRMQPLEPTIQSFTSGLPDVATGAGESYAANAAMVVSLRTANIGRAYMGRMYLPPFEETDIDSGAIDNTVAALLQSETEALIGDLLAMAPGSAVAIVWSHRREVVPHTDPPTYLDPESTDITLVKVDKVLRSQRKREIQPAQYV